MSSAASDESLGILDGVCTNGNAHFWMYFIGSISMILLVAYCRHRSTTPPKYVASSSKPDFGLPFDIAILVYNICLWCVAPNVALFVMYHMLTTDVFSKQTYLACLSLSGIPVVLVVLCTQATAILLLYRADWIRVDIASEVVPAEYGVATGNRPVKILFLGCTAHGALLIDCLQKELNGDNIVVEAHMVDFAHASGQAFVRYNALCVGVVDKLVGRFHRSIWVGDNKFNLPFEDGAFDKVILSPNVRNAAPVGEMLTGDDEKIPRMIRMLNEAMRVLRTDGELLGCDLGANAVPLWADLRHAGFTATLTETGKQSGPVPFMKSKLLKLQCLHNLPSQATTVTFGEVAIPMVPNPSATGSSIETLSSVEPLKPPMATTLDADKGPVVVVNQPVVPTMISTMDVTSADGGEPHQQRRALSDFTKLRVVVLLQCCVFFVLSILAMSLFAPLSVPTSIPISTRLSTVLAGVATGYPMMGYFSREATMSSGAPLFTLCDLLRFCLKREGIALLVSTAMTVVMGFPDFLLQVALSTSSLSVDARAKIGLVITIALAVVIFVRAKSLHRTRVIAARSIPDEYAIYL
ncbi:transmembrane protein, putative [Bodo saltans]|uniref:Transmembrane protein, putative n=1 Tax=Bodo saltans TaxID=75058 RepID=A0A0S4JHI4_BODSA|nr:transmembrane protein, putative [Bodo saltans]|eukprot:CUG89601.1 transmembrane protein, putative [Bodo saltans]